ncbi:MAG: hypothetical protein KJN72_12190 [Woeseia sp.]|nr:hypothetical protein [Woeseia sp.]
MGKGIILSGGQDGNYQLKIELDTQRVDDRIEEIDNRLASDQEVMAKLADLLAAENALNELLAALDQAINGWEALQEWLPGTDYPRGIVDGNQILIQIGVSCVVVQPGRSGDTLPPFAGLKHGETLRENEVVWSMSIRDPEGGAFWSPTTDYDVSDEVLAIPNLIIEMEAKNAYATVTKAGRSGFSQPAWTNSGTIIDGGIIWQKRDQIPALNELILEAAEAKRKKDVAEAEYDLIKLEREELRREKQYLESKTPDDPEVQAWCADVTESFAVDAEVGTVEIPGERNGIPVLIRPGHVDESQQMRGAAYDETNDGQIQPSIASTAAGVFWNWAVLPAWQKWRPQYRIGTIISIDYDQNQCSVQIEAAVSSQQDLNVNQDGAVPLLFDVPVRYMTCNAAAFSEGDRVIVEFTDHEWDQPTVIGFESNPKRCPVGQFTFIHNTGPFLNDDKLFRGAPGNWDVFDLDDGEATIINAATEQSIWTNADKSIILGAAPNFEIYQGPIKVARTPHTVLACGLNTHGDDTEWLRCVTFSGPDILAFEKPWPVTDATSMEKFDQATYDDLVTAMDTEGAAAEWAKWHLIGQSVITDLTGGPNPGVLRLGSMNADGDEAAIMLGFIHPETFIDQFGGETESEWHGYIKINLDSYSVDVFAQNLDGDNAINTVWSYDASLVVDVKPLVFEASPPFNCPPRTIKESASCNYLKTESQHMSLVVDLAYDGNVLMIGELRSDYDMSDTSSGSFSKNGQSTYEASGDGETCTIVGTSTNSSISSNRIQTQNWQLKLQIHPEGSSQNVLEAVIEDFQYSLSISGSGGNGTGSQTLNQNGSGTIGYVEFFSVLHRAAIIRRHERNDSSSEDDLLVMCVPNFEQELSDSISKPANVPVAPATSEGQLSGAFNSDGVQFLFPVVDGTWVDLVQGAVQNGSYSKTDGNDVDTERVASHFPNESKNALDWAQQPTLDANVRYFNGASCFSIYKLDPTIWPSNDPARFDTSVRYTHLTGGDPKALLEDDDIVILQQIGIL